MENVLYKLKGKHHKIMGFSGTKGSVLNLVVLFFCVLRSLLASTTTSLVFESFENQMDGDSFMLDSICVIKFLRLSFKNNPLFIFPLLSNV